MRELLELALAEGFYKAYTGKLLSAFEGQTPPPSSAQQRGDDLVEPLSAREVQVLKLLNTHLSVPEIAAEIHLAPTTVRTHVQHIYQKLGVHGRIEALQRAKEIGLL
jgi:LuxR family maltose regulon positive regulatory protein